VIQMAYEGAYAPNERGNLVKAEPDRIVLVTDFSKLAMFQGVTMRDGQSQGRRISSIGFDFASDPAENFVPMTGLFGMGQSIEGVLRVPAQHPTNPFLHRYHPDHDNLAADFREYKEEAYAVARTVALEFLPPPNSNKAVDYGYNLMAGNYRETLSGLHRRDLKVSGTFELRRLTTVGVLNE
jgi:hypothetical protein